MAAVDNNTTALIAAVRRDAFLAASDDNWTDARIMSIADDCTLQIAGALKKTKQDWFNEDFDLALVTSQSKYDVPEEAMWSSLENAFLIDITTGRVVSELAFVSSSNRMMFQSIDNGITGVPDSAYLNNSQIVFSPAPDSSTVAAYSCTVSAYRRPAQLCLPSVTVRVTAVNTVTQTLTTSTQPSSWATDAPDPYTSGTPYRLDVYNRRLPNTRELWNKTLTAPSVTALLFSPSITAAEFATIHVGDVVTLRGTSPYPDLPPEAVPFLRQMIKKTILTAQTDSQALQVYLGEKADEAAMFIKGMSNRADGSPKKLSLFNAGGSRFIRRGIMWGR